MSLDLANIVFFRITLHTAHTASALFLPIDAGPSSRHASTVYLRLHSDRLATQRLGRAVVSDRAALRSDHGAAVDRMQRPLVAV